MQKQNTPFLQSLYENCRSLGIVNNQYEFSELCGRRSTWFSASKSRDLPISTQAAVTLAIRLKNIGETEMPRRLRSHAKKLSEMLFAIIGKRAERSR